MTVQGDGARTRIVCGYNPCGNSKLNSSTTYQQHRRYFVTQQKDLSCLWVRFRQDLAKVLKKWRGEGDRLIICMDANEDIYKKSIGRTLTDREGLNMVEAVGEFTGKKIGPTFFRGSKSIDGIWTTTDIIVMHACVMPAGLGVGDQRLFCNRRASGQSHWRGTSQGTAVHLETIKHKGFKQSNQELSGPPGGQSCTTPPYRMHGGVT